VSTITKIDPLHRQRRAARRNMLRNPPPLRSAEAIAIMSELSLIAKASRLHGNVKHALFHRGARQLQSLGL
jgi:hypothetical protein